MEHGGEGSHCRGDEGTGGYGCGNRRRHGISRGLVYAWRRELGEVDLPDLVPVVVEAPIGSTGSTPSPARRGRAGANVALEAPGSIEIARAGDVRVTLRGRVDSKGLRAVLQRCARYDRSAERYARSPRRPTVVRLRFWIDAKVSHDAAAGQLLTRWPRGPHIDLPRSASGAFQQPPEIGKQLVAVAIKEELKSKHGPVAAVVALGIYARRLLGKIRERGRRVEWRGAAYIGS
jgi:hypothetical protein